MTDSVVNIKRYSVIGVIFAFIFAGATLALSYWTKIHTAELLWYVSFNTLFFSLLLFNEHRLQYRAALESDEQDQVRRSVGASKELFDESDEALLLAARSLKAWRTYILPAISIIYGLGAIVYLVFRWQAWSERIQVDMENQMAAAACAGALGVSYFLIGAFYGGASKQKDGIKLRPFSAWAYFSSIMCIALVAVLFFSGKDYPNIDHYVNRTVLCLLIFLAFEVSVNFLIDWYRPRFHKDEKSILESRLLGIFTDSGSIASNIAHALDYQFGLKVTESGFYRFFMKKFLPILAIQLVTLYLLSCFTLIETGQRGIKETLGKIDPESELTPGLHITLPWPMSKIHVFPADQIQTIEVGLEPKKSDAPEEPPMDEEEQAVSVTEDVVLWSKKGHHEEGMEDINYIISTKEGQSTNSQNLGQVNMITIKVPVHYRIKKHEKGKTSPLYQYLFEHANSKRTLKTIISEVVMTYLSTADYYDFLGKNREDASDKLHTLSQAAIDSLGLGVEIVELALETTHPPGTVSKSYDDVIAAIYEKDTSIFDANIERDKELSKAKIKEKNIVVKAESETGLIDYTGQDGKIEKVPMKLALAKEKAIRLKSQQASYESQPYLFTLINYLAVIEKGLINTKKIIVDSAKTDYNFRFDLKPKLAPDLENLEIPE